MIFITVGSREYQFNRLLKKIDDIITRNKLELNVFAQIGSSTYIPQHYEYKRFINKDEFDNYQNNAKVIISHGGTGSLMSAIKKEKKVIGVPRYKKMGEHVDDHQIQIIKALTDNGYIVSDLSYKLINLEKYILHPHLITTKKYKSKNIIKDTIIEFLKEK